MFSVIAGVDHLCCIQKRVCCYLAWPERSSCSPTYFCVKSFFADGGSDGNDDNDDDFADREDVI